MTGTAARWTRRGSLLAAAGAVTALTAAAAAPAIGSAALSGTAKGTRTLHLLGDSWAAGLHADPAHALGQVAASLIGWNASIDAISGTGYLNAAGARTYLQRATTTATGTARLVVVQGGSNDDGSDLTKLPAAVAATIAALRSRFPDAALMLLGPGPDPLPLTAVQWKVDGIIAAAAERADVPYVSMLHERWIPAEHAAAVIDAGNAHPTVAGQQYLGLRLAASLRLLFPDVLAA